jgi:UDP-N-acetyl-2-amino-2-deoxyglucuronate dehydrogenase
LGANALCEKPLVINPWNLEQLEALESETPGKIYTVLQLRVHPAILKIKNALEGEKSGSQHKVKITYITTRGPWYDVSWKGSEEKSGGVATNIGIHLFDMVQWLFGGFGDIKVYLKEKDRMSGFVELERAQVNWFLSVNGDDLPAPVNPGEPMTHRSITIDGEEIEFSGGFTDLHTRVYEKTLQGEGFGISDARASIDLTYQIRQSEVSPPDDKAHPLLRE